MIVEPYSMWVCAKCDKEYDAEPIQCECGCRHFGRADVTPLDDGLGFAVDVSEVER